MNGTIRGEWSHFLATTAPVEVVAVIAMFAGLGVSFIGMFFYLGAVVSLLGRYGTFARQEALARIGRVFYMIGLPAFGGGAILWFGYTLWANW